MVAGALAFGVGGTLTSLFLCERPIGVVIFMPSGFVFGSFVVSENEWAQALCNHSAAAPPALPDVGSLQPTVFQGALAPNT